MERIVENFSKHRLYDNQKVEIEDYLYCDNSYFVEITTTKSDQYWYGLSQVELEGCTLKNESGNRFNLYMVVKSGIDEIVKENESPHKIYNMLTDYANGIDPYLLGVSGTMDYSETLAIFENEQEAVAFMEDNFSEINFSEEIHDILNSKDLPMIESDDIYSEFENLSLGYNGEFATIEVFENEQLLFSVFESNPDNANWEYLEEHYVDVFKAINEVNKGRTLSGKSVEIEI